jgi:hypothetical protein
MNVEEMLWAMTDVDSATDKVRVSKEAVRAIAEALRAGQAMRAEVKYYYNDSTSGTRAWDAATRDDSLEEYSKLSQEIGEDV